MRTATARLVDHHRRPMWWRNTTHAALNRTRSGESHESFGARVHHPRPPRRPVATIQTTPAPAPRHAGDLRDRHQRNRREVHQRTCQRDARKHEGADRKQRRLAASDATNNVTSGARSRGIRRRTVTEADSRIPAVAPNVQQESGVGDRERLREHEQAGGDGQRIPRRSARRSSARPNR